MAAVMLAVTAVAVMLAMTAVAVMLAMLRECDRGEEQNGAEDEKSHYQLRRVEVRAPPSERSTTFGPVNGSPQKERTTWDASLAQSAILFLPHVACPCPNLELDAMSLHIIASLIAAHELAQGCSVTPVSPHNWKTVRRRITKSYIPPSAFAEEAAEFASPRRVCRTPRSIAHPPPPASITSHSAPSTPPRARLPSAASARKSRALDDGTTRMIPSAAGREITKNDKKSAAHASILTMPLDELRERVMKALALWKQIEALLPGGVVLTEAERKNSLGRLRDGESGHLLTILAVCEKYPALFASLADLDEGTDPTRFETELLRDRLLRAEALEPLVTALSDAKIVAVSDTLLHLRDLARAPISEAYAIAKTIAKTSAPVSSMLAPVLDFYRGLAARAAASRKANDDEKSKG